MSNLSNKVGLFVKTGTCSLHLNRPGAGYAFAPRPAATYREEVRRYEADVDYNARKNDDIGQYCFRRLLIASTSLLFGLKSPNNTNARLQHVHP